MIAIIDISDSVLDFALGRKSEDQYNFLLLLVACNF